jgi:hypothetical protein
VLEFGWTPVARGCHVFFFFFGDELGSVSACHIWVNFYRVYGNNKGVVLTFVGVRFWQEEGKLGLRLLEKTGTVDLARWQRGEVVVFGKGAIWYGCVLTSV